ncbi:MAG: hypothetical protein ABI806_22145 [Candidatus Solibacter sp.]
MPETERAKPGVSRLLIMSALDADMRRRLLESPDEVFQEFDLTTEQRELLRQPDHRLLRLFAAALADEVEASAPAAKAAVTQPHAIVQARSLPDISLAVTLVPCAQYENGELRTFAYAVWVNPLPQGADPASLPAPQGAEFPGQPLTPLHAVMHVSAVQMQDASGGPQVGLTAALLQATNMTSPPPPEAAGRSGGSPFGSDVGSVEVQSAVAAVRNAPGETRYDRLLDLLHALRGKEAL